MLKTKRNGFTMIELSIGLVFISILLVAISTTIINVGNSYNRGITLKSISQSGRALIADLQFEIGSVKPFNPIVQGTDYKSINGGTGGRLCLGTYSYIWNYAIPIEANTLGKNTYTDDVSTAIRLVKIADTSQYYCNNPDATIDKSKAKELLKVGDRNIALYSFDITSPETSYDSVSNSRIYNIEFYLGTSDTKLVRPSTPYKCNKPGEGVSDYNYCVVEIFSVNILSGG